MKTEPTEALSWIERRKSLNNHVFTVLLSESETGCRLAFQEGQSNPKIRQLEWTFTKNEGFSFTPFVNYRIYYWKTAYNENKVQLIYNKKSNAALNGHDGHELIGEYDNCDSAIRAAQADFEKRIKECLK